MMPYLLGLTGSIGTGKSTTARVFANLGVAVWSADEVVHWLYENDAQTIQAIGDILPEAIENNAVHRPHLRHELQKNPTLFPQIEQILHPRLKTHRADFIKTEAAKGQKLLVFDIPLLYETGAEAWLDGVLVVTIDAPTQEARVMARGTLDKAQFALLLARQMPDAQKRGRADFVITTDSHESVKRKVAELIKQITQIKN